MWKCLPAEALVKAGENKNYIEILFIALALAQRSQFPRYVPLL